MPISIDDIRAERERRLSNPAAAPFEQSPTSGITLQDIQAERARRAQPGADPFAPVGGTGDPQAEFRTNPQAEAISTPLIDPVGLAAGAGVPGLLRRGAGAAITGALSTGSGQDTAGSTAGEIAGGAIGSLTGPFKPVATPTLAAAGAGVGLAVSRYLQGEPVTAQEVTGEALLSAIPEVVTQVGGGVIRASKAARQARFGDLAAQARREAAEVFQPEKKALVSGLFDQVAQSGVKVDTSAVRRFTGSIGTRYDDLLKEVRRIDNSIKSGGEFETLITRAQAGQRGAYDIGRLQELHSELRKRISNTPNMPFEGKQLLADFDEAVDQSIFTGLAKGQQSAQAESARNTLRTARAGWARLRRTEELQDIVERSITTDRSGTGVSISLGRIRDTIRKGTGKTGRSIQRTFEHDPGSRQRFYDFLDRLGPQHDKINVSLADLPPSTLGQVTGKLGDWLATVYTSTAGQKAFEELVVSGNGRFTHSTIANLANVARREVEDAEEERRIDRRTSAPESISPP